MNAAQPGGAPRQMFADARTPQRFLRASWHPGDEVVTLSVWGSEQCLATFRLTTREVPELVGVLVAGLVADDSSPGDPLPRTGAVGVPAPPPPTAATAQGSRPTLQPRPAAAVLATSRRTALRALDLLVARAADVLRARLDRLDPDRRNDH